MIRRRGKEALVSLEVLNTAATVGTCLVITATAIAALVQLRHMRASNQIQAQLAINSLIQSQEFRTAFIKLQDLRKMIDDPSIAWAFRPPMRDDLPPDAFAMIQAARIVGSNLENIGNMIRNRLTDQRIFLEQFGNVVTEAWDLLEPYTCIRRKFQADHDTIWEDFEYLTILAREAARTQDTVFPRNRQRLLPPSNELAIPRSVEERAPDYRSNGNRER